MTNAKRLLWGLLVVCCMVACKKEEDYSIPIDGDGNVYGTLVVGGRTWMLGALHTTSYNDGSPIVYDQYWNKAGNTAVYCYYDNDKANAEKYGMLYNWAAVKSGNLAPKGWHVATEKDWTELARAFGGWEEAAMALKAIKGWEPSENDSVCATDESGLSLLPTGCRENYTDSLGMHQGEFHDLGREGFWWTSTAGAMGGGTVMNISYDSNELVGFSASPDFGAAVLCVKDK